ncbi:MAG: MBL fold metallo-hydrolase [Candidatus Thorarchaeota archaeon]
MAKVPQIRYLGQSGFHILLKSGSFVIDPKDEKSGDREGDILYCTHKHYDHTGGVNTFLERNPKAIFITNDQVARAFSRWSERTITVYPGDTYSNGPWNLEFVECRHGLFRNVIDVGVVVRTDGFSFGHPGDTRTLLGFSDFELSVFGVPIGGAVSTSPKNAISQLSQFNSPPETVVPMHWLYRSPGAFCREMKEQLPNVRCIVPSDDETITLNSGATT